ncbi:iron-sulfur cluster assembly scaffold protein [Pseudoflavonifractor sp. HCP28S3_F10]|uniref:iron-sulfur cluster assembly scaffold protein n=1 Tax=Pseudoflavonifractor sp. HCP28S3_F10 TaxID=3438947 RepID=UPI003F89E122
MYTDKVMDYFNHPRNAGSLDDPDAVGVAGNPKCGDIMQVTLRVEDGVITDARFKTFGCAAAIATSSMATEMIKGRTVEQAFTLTNEQVAEALGGLPLHKMHCSVLAEQAIKAAVGDYYVRQGILDESEIRTYGDPHEGEQGAE